MSLNWNRFFENKRTKAFAIVLLVATLVIVVYIVFNGKHNKISTKGIEVNIPVDTTPKSVITVTGSNNNVIQGNNNTLTVNSEPQLTDSIRRHLIGRIEQIQKDSGISSKLICMGETSNSNAKKLSNQVEEYLINRGYRVEQPHGTIHEKVRRDSVFL